MTSKLLKTLLMPLAFVLVMPITTTAEEFTYEGMSGNFNFTGEMLWHNPFTRLADTSQSGASCAASINTSNVRRLYFLGQKQSKSTTITIYFLNDNATSTTGFSSFTLTVKESVANEYGICNDEAGNIIVTASTSNYYNGPDRIYVIPRGTSLSTSTHKAFKITGQTLSNVQNRHWGIRAYGDCYNGTGYVSINDRGDTSFNTGQIPSTNYRVEVNGKGNNKTDGTVYSTACSVATYSMTVEGISGLMVNSSYLGYGKLFLHVPGKGMYWVQQHKVNDVNTWTLTMIPGTNNSEINLRGGASAFQLQGDHLAVFASTSATSRRSMQIYSRDRGTAIINFELEPTATGTMSAQPSAGITPYVWVQPLRQSSTEMDLYLWSRGAAFGIYRVTATPKPLKSISSGGISVAGKVVNWAPADGTAQVKYKLEVSTNGGSSWTTISSTLTATSYTDANSTRLPQDCVYRVTPIYRGQALSDWASISSATETSYEGASKTVTIAGATPCATPTFSPTSWSNETNARNVTITSATSGSTIYYTTNGSDPTTSNYAGTCASGGTAPLDGNVSSLKAIAVKSGFLNSAIGTAGAYTFKCATPTFSTSGGGTSPTTVTISSATSGATIYYTTDGSTPTTSSTSLVNGGSFTCSEIGTKTIKAIAVKSNYDNSDVASTTVTYKPQLAAPTFSVATGTQFTTSGRVTITAPAGSTLYYNTDGSEDYNYTTGINTATVDVSVATTLSAYAKQTNHTNSPTVTASYTVKCATPTITPVTGTYPKEQTVNIACATPGATIYYTLDGSTPTTSSPVYSAPFTVNDDTKHSNLIPFYGSWVDDYQKAEHIIPASSMSGLGASASNAVVLNSLSWYLYSPANGSFGVARFKVFLKEVSGTSLGGTFSGPEGGTVVYEGELDATQSTLTINFTTPFEYHGGNLLVGVYTTTPGSYKNTLFWGTTGGSDCSGYAYSSSSLESITTYTSATYDFLPKTTFTYTPNHQPIIVSSTTTVKALAVMSGCVNSDVASETITITPQSQPVVSSSINVAYSPVIGTSTNNPDRDLARIDATITFNRPNTSDGTTFPAYPTTFSDYYLDHYVVTVFSGSGDDNYAKTESGADFRSISIDAKSGAGAANTVSLNARDLKINQQTEVCVTACYVYQPTSATAQSSQTTKSFSGYTYTTYSPSISAVTYCEPHQAHDIWWEQTGESHRYYFDVYRVEITLDDDPLYNPSTSIPVSYYQLEVSKDGGTTWANVVDRTINNICYGNTIEAPTTYPVGQGIGAGRFKGNYRFTSNQIPGTEGDISFMYYWAVDVTSAYHPMSVTDPTQENPAAWLYRVKAVYGGSGSVTVDGTPVTPTVANVTSTGYTDYIPASDNPVITGVDSVKGDVNLKEVQYYDLRGVRLNEAPSTGFYIEVRLYDNGQVVTSKQLAR